MKKYLSCIILVLLCLVCAMVFYANAHDFSPIDSGDVGGKVDNTGTPATNVGTSDVPDEVKVATIEEQGTIFGEYYTDTNLRIEWAIYKLQDEKVLYLSSELYLDSPNPVNSQCSGYFTVNGEKKEFTVQKSIGTSTLLATYTKSLDCVKDAEISVEAGLDINISASSGVVLEGLFASGKIYASEAFKNMPKSYSLTVEHISQYPDLPSGDEVTALAMVLKYLKYDVDKCELCDLYLEKGPVGYTSFYKANVGNPRNAYNSYGCYPPVIVNAANKFISVNGGSKKAYDYSGYNAKELYRQVSEGNPVIVWACEDFDIDPSISRIWVVDGETLYLKSNVACMVLTGYDLAKNTVTLSNPAGTTFIIDKDLFEMRFAQMGSYAVIIK